MSKFNRRDFLKSTAFSATALTLSKLKWTQNLRTKSGPVNTPNIIFIVFDTMSAYHLSLYGYSRETTPYLTKFASKSNVYHAHYSTANFTIPGTSSMLTGLHPWTHRALQLSGIIHENSVQHNIFKALDKQYYRFAFSQNVWAENLLHQFDQEIDELLPASSFSETAMLASEMFTNDANNAHQTLDDMMFDYIESPGSLLFGLLQRLYFERVKKKNFDRNFPRGIPQPRNYPLSYKLSELFDGLMGSLGKLSSPFFSYIHVFSPHAPYRAQRDFIGRFDGIWSQDPKPEHVFTEHETQETIEKNRIWYDEYIANVDYEFGRLAKHLEETGLLENSYVIVTSDHGELLERGVKGHVTPLLYEPLIRVPLIISQPGHTSPQNIYSPTSSVDILPTILNITGSVIPEWAEGKILPGLGGQEDPERKIFAMEAKSSSSFEKLTKFTFAIRKGKYKLIMYYGYPVYPDTEFELYDLENDPQEINDLYEKEVVIATELKNELIKKTQEVNK